MKVQEIITKSFVEKNGIQRFLARKIFFEPLEFFGFHLLGDHFYEPIPNLRSLRESYDESAQPLPPCQNFAFESAAKAHADRMDRYGDECLHAIMEAGVGVNPYFRMHDIASLFALIRDLRLRRIVEVGQGYSTIIASLALQLNERDFGFSTEIISIDPFARLNCQGNALFEKRVTLRKCLIQDIPVTEIAALLGSGSMLLCDSSHVFKCGSDVEYLMRKVYPAIPLGTILHIHDIYTPFPTPKSRIVDDKLFFNEQDHLESFLAFNSAFRILCPVYWLFQESKVLHDSYNKIPFPLDLPGNSFYLERIADGV